jgi:hypothetical protein
MSLMATDNGGGNFEKAPVGNHMARCFMVADLGLQETTYGPKRKVHLSWELSGELMEDGNPYVIGQRYTLSLNEKANLRRDLESWRSRPFTDDELKGFDLFSVVGIPCMLSVVHNENNGKVYANVASVASMPKGMECPPQVNSSVSFSTDDFNQAEFDKLPEFLQKWVNIEGVSFSADDQGQQQGAQGQPAGGQFDDFDDDIPF